MKLSRNRTYRLSIIAIILACFTPVSLISKSAECSMFGSQMILPNGKASVRGIDEEKVRKMLENKIVVEKLKGYGLSKEEIIAKVEKMSDGQVHQLASLSDKIPVGGDVGLAVIIAILVVVVLVLLIFLLVKKIL